VRTTFQLPEHLWVRARQLALAERTSLRALVIEGLEHLVSKRGAK
jgi:hypothetical protein